MVDYHRNLIARGMRVARKQGVKSFVGQSISFVRERFLGRVRIEFAYPRFTELVSKCEDLDQAIELAYSFKSFGVTVKPYQEREEITRFFRLIQSQKPATVLEIGAGGGGTLFLFTRVATPDAVLVSVDLPPSFAGKGPPRWKEPLFRSFATGAQRIELVRGDSHDPSTLAEVKAKLDGRPIDALFIDGDHSYDGVKADFEMYSPLVRSGGVIAFHDIDQDHINKEIQVPRFWRETRSKFRNLEISINSHRNGIGVLYF